MQSVLTCPVCKSKLKELTESRAGLCSKCNLIFTWEELYRGFFGGEPPVGREATPKGEAS